MQIDSIDLNSVSGFYAVNFHVFVQTLEESVVTNKFEMGGGVTIIHGARFGAPIWFMDNPCGKLYGIWIEENG